jgi:hypothetical protein
MSSTLAAAPLRKGCARRSIGTGARSFLWFPLRRCGNTRDRRTPHLGGRDNLRGLAVAKVGQGWDRAVRQLPERDLGVARRFFTIERVNAPEIWPSPHASMQTRRESARFSFASRLETGGDSLLPNCGIGRIGIRMADAVDEEGLHDNWDGPPRFDDGSTTARARAIGGIPHSFR